MSWSSRALSARSCSARPSRFSTPAWWHARREAPVRESFRAERAAAKRPADQAHRRNALGAFFCFLVFQFLFAQLCFCFFLRQRDSQPVVIFFYRGQFSQVELRSVRRLTMVCGSGPKSQESVALTFFKASSPR